MQHRITDGLALQAIKMLTENLPSSYAHPENIEARSQVHLASSIAGMAFGLGGLGMVHSCSHPMSAIIPCTAWSSECHSITICRET